MLLTGRLAPDFKTIGDFRKDNGMAIRAVYAQFSLYDRRAYKTTALIPPQRRVSSPEAHTSFRPFPTNRTLFAVTSCKLFV